MTGGAVIAVGFWLCLVVFVFWAFWPETVRVVDDVRSWWHVRRETRLEREFIRRCARFAELAQEIESLPCVEPEREIPF